VNTLKLEDEDETGSAFLVFAAETSMEEIELGKLAQDLSRKTEVKQLGKMMEDEHTKALTETEDLAKQKQIVLPTTMPEKGKDAYKKLSEMSGSDFDKEYCDMMVNGHKNAIEKFSKAAGQAKDPEISAFANATLPTLKKHLNMATECQKRVNDIQSTKTTVKNN
jgi:putative membrane protein